MPDQTIKELKSLLHDQPHNPMRPEQQANMREERERLHGVANAPAWIAGANRGQAIKDLRRVDKMLAEQSSKPVTDSRRDKVARLTKEAIEDYKAGMLPKSVMRRNPAGAVDQFLRKENSKQMKDAALTIKRAMRALEPDNDEPNYTNMERFRPEGTPGEVASFMAEAQIPGNFAMSPQAKENWPLGEPTADTVLKQAQRAEAKPKREMSPEQREAFAKRMQASRDKAAARRLSNPAPAQDVPAAEGEGDL